VTYYAKSYRNNKLILQHISTCRIQSQCYPRWAIWSWFHTNIIDAVLSIRIGKINVHSLLHSHHKHHPTANPVFVNTPLSNLTPCPLFVDPQVDTVQLQNSYTFLPSHRPSSVHVHTAIIYICVNILSSQLLPQFNTGNFSSASGQTLYISAQSWPCVQAIKVRMRLPLCLYNQFDHAQSEPCL